MRAVRTHRHLYIRNFAPERWPTGGDYLSSNRTTHGDIDGAPTKDVLLAKTAARQYPREVEWCLGKRPAEELYDVEADPAQVRNSASDPAKAAELARLRARLEQHLKQTGDPRIEGRDPWHAYVYRQTTGFGASFNRSLPEAVRRQARDQPTHKPE
jgi:hypothetical protein